MLGSIRIGSVLGIQVRLHWLFALAMIAFALVLGPVETALWFGTLFGIVFLHELGHCLMARRFGIRVLDITLWPLGGMARMSEIPEDTKVESLIAIAGPAVNFALAFLAAPVWFWATLEGHETISRASGFFLGVNLALGIFNLVPAFPMDGGRVLRAFLGRNGDWVGATEAAVRVGKAFAIFMIVFGFVLGIAMGGTLNLLPVIGLFVWFAGSRELQAVRMRHAPAVDPFAGLFRHFGAADASEPRPAAAEAPRPEPETRADPSGARRPRDLRGFGVADE